MPKVLIADKLSPQAAEIFTQAGVTADVKVGMSPEELLACAHEYDGIAIRSATKITKDVLEKATNLKVVGRAGIGVDNVDIPAASAKGVVVMNTPFGNSVTTAEHTISLMMSLARRIGDANTSTHAGKWEKSKFMGVELYNKTLGMIGCGNIGGIVADRAQGMKMKVIAYDPYLSEEKAASMNVEKVEFDALLARADFITLHTPLTEQTKHILGAEALAKCKAGARIVNCARGGLIDEAALKAAIESGHIAGAALDVFEEEPAKDNALFGMENVVCTPHLGASTSEAQENVAIQVAEQMSDYLMTGAVTNALNIPSVSAEDAAKLKPYITLAEQLGSFAGQLTETGLKKITVSFEGSVAKLNTKPLFAVALKGLLEPLVSGVNMVNAPLVAEERGIEVISTTKEKAGDYQTLIRVTVETEQRNRSVAGTVFGGTSRLTEVKGIKLEAGIGENMLYVTNDDKPGFIGRLGSVMGKHGINIANFHLGRHADSKEAVALLEIDSAVSKEVLEELGALDDVQQVKYLRLVA